MKLHIAKVPNDLPTADQNIKINSLKAQGYVWDKQLSISYAGVVMRKDQDIWIFDLDGGIHHNPESITIITK